MPDHGAWGHKPIISQDDWRKGTEYGGVDGIIAPLDSGHGEHVTAAEQSMLIRNTDAWDLAGEPIYPVKKIAD